MHLCTEKDKFCFVCGILLLNHKSRNITSTFENAYKAYFDKDVEKSLWTPTKSCHTCYYKLLQWTNDKNRQMSFGTPMIWTCPLSNLECYFCQNKKPVNRFGRNHHHIKTTSTPSVCLPVPHGKFLPTPSTPMIGPTFAEIETETNEVSLYPSEIRNEVKVLGQGFLNDLCRDLNLSHRNSELLISRLKWQGVTAPDVKITEVRGRQSHFKHFFITEGQLTYCSKVVELLKEFDTNYEPRNWRLFIDGSVNSLKVVMLHNGNQLPPIPVAYSNSLKEEYNTLKMVLKSINYDEHKWMIIADFKVIAILCGLQGGNVKYPCIHCLWDSRDRKNHYNSTEHQKRTEFRNGEFNVKNKTLVDIKHILFPPLHLKLGLVKNFLKSIRNDEIISYLKQVFPKISVAKLEEGK